MTRTSVTLAADRTRRVLLRLSTPADLTRLEQALGCDLFVESYQTAGRKWGFERLNDPSCWERIDACDECPSFYVLQLAS